MNPILLIARTEVLEQRRQPWMVFILALNYVLTTAACTAAFLAFDQPDIRQQLAAALRPVGGSFELLVGVVVTSFQTWSLTTLPLYVAFLSGTSVLHDRDCGTLPFLLLAPVTRLQLLAGKLLGVLAIPLLLHLTLVGASTLAVAPIPVLAPYAPVLGGSAAWWVAFLCGAPAAGALTGALGTVISARSRDVRTSIQFTSFSFGFLSMGIGYVLVDAVAEGVASQALFATGCLGMAAACLLVGARLIGREVED